MNGDPGDTSGADYGGGTDGEIQLIQPYITSGAQTINGNTFNSGFSYTFQLNANPGSPDTNLTWSLDGVGSLSFNGFYTFPSLSQGQTASGSLVFTVSNLNGSTSQTWNYTVVNTQPPFFTSSTPAALNGNTSTQPISISYTFTANRGAPDTNSPISWSISPQEYVGFFEGSSDTERTVSLYFPQGTIVNGSYTITISNTNGSASQTWGYDVNIGTTDGGGGGGGDGLWELLQHNEIQNTNTNGVIVNGRMIVNNKFIFNGAEFGYIYNITRDVLPSAVRPEGGYYDGNNDLWYYYYRLVDGNGYIDWKNISNAPDFGGDKGLEIFQTMMAAFAAIAALGLTLSLISERIANWIRHFFNYDQPLPERNTDDNGRPDQRTAKIYFSDLVHVPFVASRVRFGVNTDFYLKESQSMITLPNGRFSFDDDECLEIASTTGGFKFFDGASKYFFGQRFNAGSWSFRSNGIFYNNTPILYRQDNGLFVFRGTSSGETTGAVDEITAETPITSPNTGSERTRPNRSQRATDLEQNPSASTSQPAAQRATPPSQNSVNPIERMLDSGRVAMQRLSGRIEQQTNRIVAKSETNIAKAGVSLAKRLKAAQNPNTYKTAFNNSRAFGKMYLSKAKTTLNPLFTL
jgi:hypothetical protein